MFRFFHNIFEKLLRLPQVLRGKDTFIRIDFECEHITLGNPEKSWTVCPFFLDEDSVVYSFGIGYNISFELELINHFDVALCAFDPTPKSVAWLKKQNLPKQFVLKEYGLAHFNGKAKFHPPENPEYISARLLERQQTKDEAYKVEVRDIGTIMKELNHQKIDLLKMNISGAEYDVINNLIELEIKPTQLIIEFHHKFDELGTKRTCNTVDKLRDYGYLIFSISKKGEKISFIRKELGGF